MNIFPSPTVRIISFKSVCQTSFIELCLSLQYEIFLLPHLEATEAGSKTFFSICVNFVVAPRDGHKYV